MLKFFRKIRQKLLSKDKFSKYFLYAIGEIVLVVIGILIALQINNQNEVRKTKIVADTYVAKIIGDLEKDLKNIDSLMVMATKNISEVERYFDLYESQRKPEVDLLLDSIRKVAVSKYRYTPINYTFKDMLSSGNSSLLSENQRSALIALSNTQDFFLIVFEKDIDEILRAERQVNSHFELWSTRKGIDFYGKLGMEQPHARKIEGLLHYHNALSWYHQLGKNVKWLKQAISEKTAPAIKALKE